MRTSRTQWLDAGLHLLADEGYAALSIERLCQSRATTKGSFYHHFGSLNTYREALLERYRDVTTLSVIADLEALPPLTRLRSLLDMLAGHPAALERALRTWSRSDSRAAAFQEELDAQRSQFVAAALEQGGMPPQQAVPWALSLLWMFIGSQQVNLPSTPHTRRELFQMQLSLLEPLLERP